MRYIYSADYDAKGEDRDTSDSVALTHVKVHTIADKYDVPGLAALAVVKFETHAVTAWESDDFALAIKEMYTVAADSKSELQKKAVQIACENANALFAKEESLLDQSLFRQVSDPRASPMSV